MNWKGCHVCNSVFCVHIRVIRWMHSSSSTPESLHTVIVVGYVEQKLLDTPAISKFAFILSNEITKWQGANFPQMSNAICWMGAKPPSCQTALRRTSAITLSICQDCVQMSTKRAVWGRLELHLWWKYAPAECFSEALQIDGLFCACNNFLATFVMSQCVREWMIRRSLLFFFFSFLTSLHLITNSLLHCHRLFIVKCRK